VPWLIVTLMPGCRYEPTGTKICSALFVMQRAYPFMAAIGGATSSVTPFRRYSYDSGGGVLAWTPWESASSVPVGTTIWINDTVAPAL
jgi:hypothetical protein